MFCTCSLQINQDSESLVICGILCSGCAYYISGVVMQERGPVFVTAFNPLGMVIIAVLGSFILSEKLNLGRYITTSMS
ncbi:hypothetical protein Hdeb2414_s0518g00909261 [Helianthus debilis subsp. tardiflorus]